jgi:CheY-like chemotaxis protein
MQKSIVLIVVDSQELCRLIRSLIEPLVGEIVECADGRQAVTICGNRQLDWVLIDVRMKSLDGLSAAREILLCAPETKIVIFADDDDERTRKAAIKAGAWAFFCKDNLLPVHELLSPRPNACGIAAPSLTNEAEITV